MSEDFPLPVSRKPKAVESKRKSEVVTVRLDPKLKYLAELAARRHRRTLSSFIEWAIEDSLSRVQPAYTAQGEQASSFADSASLLWDVDEPDRFAKLALNYPDLLDHEEQRIWKLVYECRKLWKGTYGGPKKEDWQCEKTADSLNWVLLREYWIRFRKVARGEESWLELRNDLYEEIPF